MAGEYWLSDRVWTAIEPVLPTNQPGARRVGDRRVISGIIHVLRSGCRWQDCPSVYGPATTIYNRFNRWSHKGLWTQISTALSAQAECSGEPSIDSTAVRAHRSAHGGKGGENSGHRALAWRADDKNTRPDRCLRPGDSIHPRPGARCRYLRRTRPARPVAAPEALAGRQGALLQMREGLLQPETTFEGLAQLVRAPVKELND